MKIKSFSLFLAFLILYTYILPMPVSAASTMGSPEILRLSGKTRYDTACEIAKSRVQALDGGKADTVIIANGLNYADALAGVPLSDYLDAPILLTANKGTLEPSVLSQIESFDAVNAYILGGTFAVSDEIAAQLKDLGLTVTRLSGQSRYDTAVEIAQFNCAYFDSSTTAFLVSGENFPDALSAGAVAGITHSNILFCPQSGEIKDSVADFIERNSIDRVVIVGGTIAINERAEIELSELGVATKRIYGTSRYATSLSIYNEYSEIFDPSVVSLATGADFPDALAGGALSSSLYAPVILINNEKNNSDAAKVIAAPAVNRVIVYGGETALSNATIDSILTKDGAAVTTTAAPTTTTTTKTTASTTASGYGKNAKYVVNPDYKSKYYIVVFAGDSQSVAVYSKDSSGKYSVLTKCFTCSTGAKSSPTRTGQYKIWRRFRWRLLVGDVYGQYSTSISKSYLFHSVPYFKQDPSSLDMAEYDKLGSPASHGCIRLCVRDAKWIYDNCPNGTQVNIVNASGPKGAGYPARIKNSTYKGWDPSDPNSNNPYLKKPVTSTTSRATTTATTTTTVPGPWVSSAEMDRILSNVKAYAESIGMHWDTSLNADTAFWGAATQVVTTAYTTSAEYENRVKGKLSYYFSKNAGYEYVNVIITDRGNGDYAMTCYFR